MAVALQPCDRSQPGPAGWLAQRHQARAGVQLAGPECLRRRPYRFSDDDNELDIESGLADIEAAIRLRYEITREIAPYIGINHERLLGDTRDIVKAGGADTSDTQAVAGIRFWF